MSNNFTFDEESYSQVNRVARKPLNSFAQLLVQRSGGIIKTETQANLILVVASVVLLIGAIVHFRNSTPPMEPEHTRGVSSDELEAYRSVQPF